MSLMMLKANASDRIAPEALFGGPVLAALSAQGPTPGAGSCSFLIVEDVKQEGFTVDLETAEVYAGIPEDARCKLVLHANAFDAMVRGKPIDNALSARDGGAEIYGDPSMLETISALLAGVPLDEGDARGVDAPGGAQ